MAQPSATVHLADDGGPADESKDQHDSGERAAFYVFVALLAVAFPLILIWTNHLWFSAEEFDFLAARRATSLDDLLEPHNLVHWSAVPLLFYRGLFAIFGVHSYVPYQVVVVTLQLISAYLLRVVMRRAGVSPWIATLAAGAFVLFGTGHQNIVWAFQMSFQGSLVLGLTHLLLADHDGPWDRRDWLGLLAGSIGLLCSGVSITMAAVVGMTTLFTRGWRVAAAHTVPLGLVYGTWWLSQAGSTGGNRGNPMLWLEFIWRGQWATWDGLGQVTGVGLALIAMLVVGLVLAAREPRGREWPRRLVLPLSLLAGSFVFLFITALGRVAASIDPFGIVVLGPEGAKSSRYVHLVAALSLPALAVAADAIIRQWRRSAPAVIVLLLLGIPGNVHELATLNNGIWSEGFNSSNRNRVLALAVAPLAEQAPASHVPYPVRFSKINIGWLRDGTESGQIPELDAVTPQQAADADVMLALQQTNETGNDCIDVMLDEPLALEVGQSLHFVGDSEAAGVSMVLITPDGLESRPRVDALFFGSAFHVVAGPVTIRVEPTSDLVSAARCTP